MKLHKGKSTAFNIGYADTEHGITTFPPNGTDRAKTIHDWKTIMDEAANKCQDKQYAQGVKEALKLIK